jgi:hypothetical protein
VCIENPDVIAKILAHYLDAKGADTASPKAAAVPGADPAGAV